MTDEKYIIIWDTSQKLKTSEEALRVLRDNGEMLALRQHARQLMETIATTHRLTVDDFKGPVRTYRISHPRQYAMWRIRKDTGLSYPEIGRMFNKDHTSVINACQVVPERLAAKAVA